MKRSLLKKIAKVATKTKFIGSNENHVIKF